MLAKWKGSSERERACSPAAPAAPSISDRTAQPFLRALGLQQLQGG